MLRHALARLVDGQSAYASRTYIYAHQQLLAFFHTLPSDVYHMLSSTSCHSARTLSSGTSGVIVLLVKNTSDALSRQRSIYAPEFATGDGRKDADHPI